VAVVEHHRAVPAAVWCVWVGGLEPDEGIPFRPPRAGPREPFAFQPVLDGRGVAAERLPAAVVVERVGDRTRQRRRVPACGGVRPGLGEEALCRRNARALAGVTRAIRMGLAESVAGTRQPYQSAVGDEACADKAAGLLQTGGT